MFDVGILGYTKDLLACDGCRVYLDVLGYLEGAVCLVMATGIFRMGWRNALSRHSLYITLSSPFYRFIVRRVLIITNQPW